VAAVLEALLRQTRLGARMGHLIGQENLEEEQIQRLCVLAALHLTIRSRDGSGTNWTTAGPSPMRATGRTGFTSASAT